MEYILYLWQIEDLIRANGFDPELIRVTVVDQFEVGEEDREALMQWYSHWIDIMKKEDLLVSGHMQFLHELIYELNDLHLNLINDLHQEEYLEQYRWAKPHIQSLKSRIGVASMCEIEVCLTGLYGLLLMRLQQKEVSSGTLESISTFSNLLALLNVRYLAIRNGKNPSGGPV